MGVSTLRKDNKFDSQNNWFIIKIWKKKVENLSQIKTQTLSVN